MKKTTKPTKTTTVEFIRMLDYVHDTIDADHEDREAFASMRRRVSDGTPLSVKQEQWLRDVFARLGGVQRAENVFSEMDERRRAEEIERARAVVLPWEQADYPFRPKLPPNRK